MRPVIVVDVSDLKEIQVQIVNVSHTWVMGVSSKYAVGMGARIRHNIEVIALNLVVHKPSSSIPVTRIMRSFGL